MSFAGSFLVTMATAESKSKKLDIILGLDSKVNPKPAQVDVERAESLHSSMATIFGTTLL